MIAQKKLLDKFHDVGILNGNINYEIIINC